MSPNFLPRAVLSGALALSGTNTQVRDLVLPQPLDANSIASGFGPGGAPFSAAVGTRVIPSPWATPVDAVQTESRWRDYVMQRLAQLWRGEGDFTGLSRPSEYVIRRARDLCLDLFRDQTPTPSVVPSEDGEVLFIWHKAGWKVEIEVGPEEVLIWAHGSSGATLSGSLAEWRKQVLSILDLLADPMN